VVVRHRGAKQRSCDARRGVGENEWWLESERRLGKRAPSLFAHWSSPSKCVSDTAETFCAIACFARTPADFLTRGSCPFLGVCCGTPQESSLKRLVRAMVEKPGYDLLRPHDSKRDCSLVEWEQARGLPRWSCRFERKRAEVRVAPKPTAGFLLIRGTGR
jgi:hypothetical protein